MSCLAYMILIVKTRGSKDSREGECPTPQRLRQLQHQKSGVQQKGLGGSTKLQKSHQKLVQRKQREAASDNAYNCPIIAVSEFGL